jgi:hypothetical protein
MARPFQWFERFRNSAKNPCSDQPGSVPSSRYRLDFLFEADGSRQLPQGAHGRGRLFPAFSLLVVQIAPLHSVKFTPTSSIRSAANLLLFQYLWGSFWVFPIGFQN